MVDGTCAPVACVGLTQDCEIDFDCCTGNGSVCGETSIIGEPVCCIPFGNACEAEIGYCDGNAVAYAYRSSGMCGEPVRPA